VQARLQRALHSGSNFNAKPGSTLAANHQSEDKWMHEGGRLASRGSSRIAGTLLHALLGFASDPAFSMTVAIAPDDEHTFLVSDSNDATSSTTLLAVNDRSLTFTVPDTPMRLHMSVPVADGRLIFAMATIDAAEGRLTVTLRKTAARMAPNETMPPGTHPPREMRLYGTHGTALEYALRIGKDFLIITPGNADTAAALLSPHDETLLKLVLGEAIVKAVTDGHVTKLHSVQLQR
jgi:hypothetical protein